MVKNLKSHKPNILVIGDLMIDHYLWGSSNRISPEAPVQVVDVKNESAVLGGAGNVINNLKVFGSDISVVSVIGDDNNGKELISYLENIGVDTSYLVIENDRKTTKKSRVIASNQQIIRFDSEDKVDISLLSQGLLRENIKSIIQSIDIIILSDYGKGVLSKEITKQIIELANSYNKRVLVDPKGDDYTKYTGAYLLTPNKKEASQATKINIIDENSLLSATKYLKDNYALKYSVITLSEDGVSVYHDNNLHVVPTVAKEVYDVTGAGDTVIASLAFALSSGMDIYKSLEFSNYCAGVVVSKIGSATASLDEVDEYISSLHKSTSDHSIKKKDEIASISQVAKSKKKRIVFTNGCFDILHVGHVKYLEVAKSFGDILIVGLNSDESVKRLKGEDRPINPQYDRAYLLAGLESVDYVVPFEEDTPYELIKAVLPHVLVKGGDYKDKDVVGSDIADEVRLVEFVDGKSTTNMIAKIQGEYC
jgi:D-beta-D-heptose 7-phosphate kinase/D-beta-D-heptose 1-phosphate adenosyltransferase